MMELNGGPRTLGLNGFLEHLVNKFVHDMKPLNQNQPTCISLV